MWIRKRGLQVGRICHTVFCFDKGASWSDSSWYVKDRLTASRARCLTGRTIQRNINMFRNEIKWRIHSARKLLSFQNFEDVQNVNFVICFVHKWNVISYFEGRTLAWSVRTLNAQENIEVYEKWSEQLYEYLRDLYRSPKFNIIRIVKPRKLRWTAGLKGVKKEWTQNSYGQTSWETSISKTKKEMGD